MEARYFIIKPHPKDLLCIGRECDVWNLGQRGGTDRAKVDDCVSLDFKGFRGRFKAVFSILGEEHKAEAGFQRPWQNSDVVSLAGDDVARDRNRIGSVIRDGDDRLTIIVVNGHRARKQIRRILAYQRNHLAVELRSNLHVTDHIPERHRSAARCGLGHHQCSFRVERPRHCSLFGFHGHKLDLAIIRECSSLIRRQRQIALSRLSDLSRERSPGAASTFGQTEPHTVATSVINRNRIPGAPVDHLAVRLADLRLCRSAFLNSAESDKFIIS